MSGAGPMRALEASPYPGSKRPRLLCRRGAVFVIGGHLGQGNIATPDPLDLRLTEPRAHRR
jgi:hypothetical protein